MRRSIPLQEECLPSIYIYIQSTKDARYIAHVPVPVHRIGESHSQFRPKLHVFLCWCVCVGVYCIYLVYVCKWTQQTARTHAWDARTNAYMYTWLTEPLPDARQLPAGERKRRTNITRLYLGRYLHARISPLDTLYIYGDSHTSEAEHKQAEGQGRPV